MSGGLQFDAATRVAYGGDRYAPMADEATKAQQIEIAELVRADRGGFGAWPSCSRSLRLPD
ncbi:transglycosylase family protein [Pseudonocardia autotrophica]|uniref:transglycosylase family protein n=1 Tax=Pseudonocardia autotrophica TaxID=2074 RepID=UPI0022B26368|nr:transglycosylase family protein [Pseudonocardia autotrophica]